METLDKPKLLKELSNGIQIYFVPLVEHISLGCTFEPEDAKELSEKIDNYELEYFCAKVYATFEGIEIATDYLGCCVYESFEEFYNGQDYIIDMIRTVEQEGINYLKELKEKLNFL